MSPEAGAPREDHKLSAGTVGGIAHLIHDVSMRNQRFLDLVALAESQGRVGRENVTVRRDIGPSKAHKRSADLQ